MFVCIHTYTNTDIHKYPMARQEEESEERRQEPKPPKEPKPPNVMPLVPPCSWFRVSGFGFRD